MDFNWEALAGFFALGLIFIGGIWKISSQIRGLEDDIRPITELIQAKNDHEKRLTKIETVCKMTHPGRSRGTAVEATETT